MSDNLSSTLDDIVFGNGVSLSLHWENPQNLYTEGDLLSGEITLNLKKKLDLTKITVEYKVDEAAEWLKPLAERVKNKHQSPFKSPTRLYQDIECVFPTKNDQEYLQMSKITLPEGQHKFPFEFRVPGGLPPSFIDTDNAGAVRHAVLVTVSRPSAFKKKAQYEWPIQYVPSADPSLLKSRSLSQYTSSVKYGGLFSREKLEINCKASVPEACQANTHAPLNILLESADKSVFTVCEMSCQLVSEIDVKAKQGGKQEYYHNMSHCLFQRSMHLEGPSIDLSNQTGEVLIPNNLVPSFHTEQLKVAYKLEFSIKVVVGPKRKLNNIQWTADIRVLGPFLNGERRTRTVEASSFGGGPSFTQSIDSAPDYHDSKADYEAEFGSGQHVYDDNVYPPEKTLPTYG